ncbi:MAG: transcriptional regulator [Candidatus Omnitrophota bacterium]|nr:MAG: transcriptional regulator [Candidatus Omnitrophota bacterium]
MGKVIRMKLAKRIKKLRKKYGYTQERLSQLADIDYKYLQRIEGKNPPNIKIDTLEKLAKAFNISLSKLLDFEK